VAPDRDLPFAFFGLGGTHDFNYPELLDLDRTLGKLGLAHAFDSFEGRHGWAPPASAARALAWLELTGMRRGVVAKRASLIEEEWRQTLAQARALESGGDSGMADPVAAHRLLQEAVATFSGLRDVTPAASELARLAGSEAFRRESEVQQRAESQHAAYGESARLALGNLLQEEPGSVNVKRALNLLEVPRLRREASEHASRYARDAAARSLESLFVQAGFYIPRALAERGDYAGASLCLAVAAEIHPESAYTWYSLARARAQSGEKRGALEALKRAFDAGFEDRAGVESDQAFARLRGNQAFQDLLRR
jgi:tetratricopeptide (TPR) repeat protein